MKKIFTLLSCIIILQSCSKTITVPNKTVLYPMGISTDLVTAATTPQTEGDKLRNHMQSFYIPQIRKKANQSQKVLLRTGIMTAAVGTLGTGVSGFLTTNKQQRGLVFSISALATTLGVVQIFSGGNPDFKNFLSDLERSITSWEISLKNQASYNTFRASVGDILAKYGDLYVEEPEAETTKRKN